MPLPGQRLLTHHLNDRDLPKSGGVREICQDQQLISAIIKSPRPVSCMLLAARN